MKEMFSEHMPACKRRLITKEFLIDFIEELRRGRKVVDGWLLHYVSTVVFYDALKVCCRKHGIYEEIYVYFEKLPPEISDLYDDELLEMAVEFGIVSRKEYPEEMPEWWVPIF